jgi:hypothetical protein
MQCPVCFDDKARELDSAAGLVEVECQRWLSQVSGGQWASDRSWTHTGRLVRTRSYVP